MRTHLKWWVIRALALLLAASAASAQERVPFRQEELDQMLAPVALYPDSLLSQMLMASTYPLEVVQAARWSRANPTLKGQDAVRAVEPMDWDSSVKSLTAFPQVLSMMDEKLEWTERLGEAFLAQQADVMDTIQGMRRRAEAAGNLESNDRMRVARQGEVIAIEPPAPGVVYVPYYSPLVVYGPWWWPLYPPVYWAPPPYYVIAAHRPAFYWGSGIVISAGFFFGHFDWPRRHVQVVHVHQHNPGARPIPVHSTWHHDPAHRRGVPFRHAATPQRFEQARPGGDPQRRDVAPAERRYTDRTAETRQRRWNERGQTTPERREFAGSRARAIPQGFTPPASDRPRVQSDTRRPQARSAEARPVVVPPRPDPRPTVVAPTTPVEPRKAVPVEPRRAIQVEPRKAVQVESRPAVQRPPRAEVRVNGRPVQAAPSEPRHVVRESPPVSRAAAGVQRPAPRIEGNHQRDMRARGNGQSERKRPADRDGGRRS